VVNEGSGSAAVAAALAASHGTRSEGTSRAVFSAFAEALDKGIDVNSGGAPQPVGLYRVGPGRTFGIVDHGRRFLHGLPVIGRVAKHGLEWRNELFERCDGTTGKRLIDAQRH
jgi:hypothetical protein